MALPATLHHFEIALNHVDRGIEQALVFKAARHPSETLERLWLRALAYCWQWEDRIAFGPGLSEPDAPDLEVRDYTGQLTRWIRVGKPQAAKVQKAIDQNPAAKIAVLMDGADRLNAFLDEARGEKLTRIAKAELAAVDATLLAGLADHDDRRAKLTLTWVGDHLYVDREGETLDGPLIRGTL
jgi:uncharacterized protein YaeQ